MNPLLGRGFMSFVGCCSVYVERSWVGMAAPMSSKAWRCRGVVTASLSMRTPPAKTMVLRVRVAKWLRSVARLWTVPPSGRLWRESLARAASERGAGATGLVRSGGLWSV
jgi:hypothetical protein